MIESSLLPYFYDSLSILRRSLNLARAGEPWFYRVVALQLRLLLCDTTRRHSQVVDISLAPRLIPDLRLPVPPSLALPASIDPLPVKDWLDLSLPLDASPENPGGEPAYLTVRGLIRRVCDQDGGAHVDVHAGGPFPGSPDAPVAWMLTLGDLAYQELSLHFPRRFLI